MIEVEKIIPGGMALGTNSDGKKIFFWNALPGESVESFQITKNKLHFIEAIATDVINPSKFRVNPKDDCFLSTSPWQIIDFNYENQLKVELVKEVFRQAGVDFNYVDLPEVTTEDEGRSPVTTGRTDPCPHNKITPAFSDKKDYFYRNKMEYALYWNNELQKISLALHQRGSHRKIPITSSSIERPEIFKAATEIVDNLNKNHAEARNYQSLLLRCNQKGEISGGLYENHKPHPIFSNLKDEILGQTYSYSPNGFFQINLPVYEMALKQIKKHVTTDKVLDLYAGVGTIGLSVARDKKLTLVEVDKSAFAELENNTKQATNLSAILAKSEDVTNYIEPDITVILDPPRAGCDIKLINKLNEIKPEKIIYLSCNPATQARDIKNLLKNYKIQDIQTFNFFPHTPHIENLVILQKV